MTIEDELSQAKAELLALRQALRRWTAATDYTQACRHWAEVRRQMNLHINGASE